MTQYSVYLRFCAGKEQAEAHERKIEQAMPASGKVHIIAITDKQYENIRTTVDETANRARKSGSVRAAVTGRARFCTAGARKRPCCQGLKGCRSLAVW